MTTPKTAFILSKDPVLEHTGDVALARMLMQLAADSFEVSAIALSPEPGTVTADMSADGRSLLVHCLDATDADAIRDDIKSRYETRLMRIFE